MAQLDADQYLQLTTDQFYGNDTGFYWDQTNSKIVAVISGVVVQSWDAAGLTISGEAQGDLLYYDGTNWTSLVAKADGKILIGDGTDLNSVSVTGDVAITNAGVTSVSDLTIASEARGDLLYRGASAWVRLAAKTDGQILIGDGTDLASVAVTGDVAITNAGVTTVTDLTISGETGGDLLYFDSSNWVRLAKGSAGQALTMNSGATAPEWASILSQLTLRVPSASGKDTDAYNGALAGCENAGDITLTDSGATYCQVYDASATAYAALETASAGDFVQWQLFPNNTQDTDIVYFGYSIPFCQMHFDMSATNQTYTGDATTWQYWDGNSWETIVVNDYTDATAQDGKRSFGRDGSISFVPPSDWASTDVNSVTAYWIRCNAGTAANISQIGITNSVRHKIASPTDGLVIPQACTITDVAIRDEAATVHTATDVIFILHNFTTGASSTSMTFAQDKRNDTFASLSLPCAADDVVGVLIVQEDGTNEIGPFSLEIGITLT